MDKDLKILISLNDLDEKLKMFRTEEYRELFQIHQNTLRRWEKKRESEFKKLPIQIQENYTRLVKRYGFGLASVSEGSCNCCGAQLPTSFLVKKGAKDTINNCPNCGIYLIL